MTKVSGAQRAIGCHKRLTGFTAIGEWAGDDYIMIVFKFPLAARFPCLYLPPLPPALPLPISASSGRLPSHGRRRRRHMPTLSGLDHPAHIVPSRCACCVSGSGDDDDDDGGGGDELYLLYQSEA